MEQHLPLDPQSRALVDEINALNSPPVKDLPLDQSRKNFEKLAGTSQASLKQVRNLTIEGPYGPIPLRLYIPHGKTPHRVLVYFHGGGWVRGNLNSHDAFCRDICEQSQFVIVAVDYRLAPESRFPIAIEECYAATQWVATHIQNYHGNPKQISVGGDSAGGNFAAVVCLMTQERGGAKIISQLLIYPATNCDFETASHQRFGKGYILTKENMLWYWDCYLRNPEDGKNPYVSPLLAKHLEGLPPCLVVVAEYDPLHDEGLAYASRLKAAGVPTNVLSYNTIHSFIFFAHRLEIGKKAIQDVANWLLNQK